MEAEPSAEATSSVTADAATQGASQPDLAENSPLESFPGAAVSPEGKAFGDEAAPVVEKEAPVAEDNNIEEAPAPVEEEAVVDAPVEEVPAPVVEEAAPAVEEPAPVEEEAEASAEETSSVTADAVTQGASQPDLAENSPLESFPGAAVSPEGKAFGEEVAPVEEEAAPVVEEKQEAPKQEEMPVEEKPVEEEEQEAPKQEETPVEEKPVEEEEQEAPKQEETPVEEKPVEEEKQGEQPAEEQSAEQQGKATAEKKTPAAEEAASADKTEKAAASEKDIALFVVPDETAEGKTDAASSDSAARTVVKTLRAKVGGYLITASGEIPEGAEIQAVEIPAETAEKMAGKKTLFAYDIRIVVDGKVWQPEDYQKKVQISVNSLNGNLDQEYINILHVKKDLLDEGGALTEEALEGVMQDLTEGSVETEDIFSGSEKSAVSFDMGSFSPVLATAMATIQGKFQEALKGKKKLNEKITITLDKNTTYEDGDVELSIGDKTYEEGFEVELIAEDAAEDALESEGTTIIGNNLTIKGIPVTMIGIRFAVGKTVTVQTVQTNQNVQNVAKLNYYGTRAADTLTVNLKGEKSEANIQTGAENDTVTVTAEGTGEKVNVDSGTGDDTLSVRMTGADSTADLQTGDGNDAVTAEITNGTLTIDTGAGDDQVAATAKEVSTVNVDTGAGNDTVGLVNQGHSFSTVNTGSGEDLVGVDAHPDTTGAQVSPETGRVEVFTGADNDRVTITNKGDESGYQHGAIHINTGSGANQVDVDLSVAKTVARIDINSENGNDALHITGKLRDLTADEKKNKDEKGNIIETRITGTEQDLTLDAASKKKIRIVAPGVESVTDDLSGKQEVQLYTDAQGKIDYTAERSFVNYVIKVPTGELKDVKINPASGKSLIMTNVLIDTQQSWDNDNELTINKGTVIDTRGLKLMLKGRKIEVDGTIMADLIRMEASDGTKDGMKIGDVYSHYYEKMAGLESTEFNDTKDFAGVSTDPGFWKTVGSGVGAGIAAGAVMLWDMVNVNDEAAIIIGKDAEVKSAGDVIMVAKVEQSGGLHKALSNLNLVNVKVGHASVEIAGKVYAGYDFKKNTATRNGSVIAEARLSTSMGYDGDKIANALPGGIINGFPISVNVATVSGTVEVKEGAVVQAGKDISLSAKTELKTAAWAESGLGGMPASIAVSVLNSETDAVVNGSMTAGGNVTVSAKGSAEAKTIAEKGEGQESMSGAYGAISVVLQKVKAHTGSKAVVTADGSVKVLSSAVEKVENHATSGSADTKHTETPGIVKAIVNLIKNELWTKVIKKKLNEKDAKKLENVMNRVVTSDNSVRLDANAESNGQVSVDSVETEENGKVKLTHQVKVTPWEGYKVAHVYWRGYNPGENNYTAGEVSRGANGLYSFDATKQNITIFVLYEEDGSGSESAADLFGEDEQDDSPVNITNMINNVSGGADSNSDTQEESSDSREIKLERSGLLLYNLNEGAAKALDVYKCPEKVKAGTKLQMLPNPESGKKLKEGSVKATYWIDANGKGTLTEKTVTIKPDDQGRYFFTVPEEALNKNNNNEELKIRLKAEYVNVGDRDASADETQTQVTGTIGVAVASNDNQALIDKGAQVTAGKGVTLSADAVTNVSNIADGTAIGKEKGESKPGKDALAISRPGEETMSGAFQKNTSERATYPKYGLQVDGYLNGSVTVEKAESANRYEYKATAVPANENYEVDKAMLVYYKDGKRQTKDLKKNDDGTYSVDLASSAYNVDEFSTATLFFTFVPVKDAGVKYGEVVEGTQHVTSVVAGMENPIKISVNAQKNKDDKDHPINLGSVEYVKTERGDQGQPTYYVFEVSPEQDYRLAGAGEGELIASWKDPSGASHEKKLVKLGGEWRLATDDIPAGMTITVAGKFEAIYHAFTAEQSKGGTVALHDSGVIREDKPRITVTPDGEYSLKDITVTYTDGKDGMVKSFKLSDNGNTALQVMPAKDSNNKDIENLYTFTVPELKYGTGVKVSAEFTEKSIILDDSRAAGEDDYTLSAYRAAQKDKITVTLSDKHRTDGDRVGAIKVTDAQGNEIPVTRSGDSFTVPESVASDASLKVDVKIEQKDIVLTKAETQKGTVTPTQARADAGDKVEVTVEPKTGYRLDRDTLKVVFTGTDRNGKPFTEEVAMSRRSDTSYTFVMPSFDDVDPKKVQASIQCVFIPGQADTNAVNTSLGAGVAVTVVNSESRADLKGKVSAGAGVSANSSLEGGVSTQTKAGYSKGNIGVGGAVSVQVASLDSKALVHRSAEVSLDGALAISSESKIQNAVSADASGNKKAGDVGVGAAIAVAVNGADTFAAVADGAKLSARTAGGALDGVSLNAVQTLTDKTEAKAGAAGGTAAVPVAAVDVSASTVNAQMGKVLNSALPVGDRMAVSATVNGEHTVTADASAAGNGVGVGAAIGVSIISDKAHATLNQSVQGRNVSVTTDTISKLTETITASASGGKPGEKQADAQADGLAGGASRLAKNNKSSGISGNGIQSSMKNRQKSETSEGSVGVAGAVAVNVQTSESISTVSNGVNVKAEEQLQVTALNGTAAKVMANASVTNSNIGVGVGVAVNIIKLKNLAEMGDGDIEAAMMRVSATTRETMPQDIVKAQTGNSVQTVDQLTRELTDMVTGYVKELANELGIGSLPADVTDMILQPIIEEVTGKLIDATGLKAFVGEGGLEAMTDKAEGLMKGLLDLPEKLVDPFVKALKDAGALTDMSPSEIFDMQKKLLANYIDEFKKQILDKKTLMSVLNRSKDGIVDYVKKDVGGLLKGVFSKKFFNTMGDLLTEVGKSIGSSVSKEVKIVASSAWSRTLQRTDLSGLNLAVDAYDAFKYIKDAKDREGVGSVIDDAVDTLVKELKNVFDYEAMLKKLASVDFKDTIVKGVREGAKKVSVNLTNAVLSKLTSEMGVEMEEQQKKATGHIIDTQAVSGAGTKDVGIAGSVAITVLNTETRASIADGGKLEVGRDLTLEAKELRSVKNVSSAALDAKGNAATNKASEDKDNGNTGGGSQTESTAVNDAKTTKLTVGAGGEAVIRNTDKPTNRPKVYIVLKDGYQLPEGNKVNYTYTNKDGFEVSGTVTAVKDGDSWAVDTSKGELAKAGKDIQIALEVKPEEVLHKISAPQVLSDTDVEAGAVTVQVKDREVASDNTLSARVGEKVQIVVHKKEGRILSGIGYSYKDKDGKTHDVELNPANGSSTGKEKAYTLVSSNADEIIYTFDMPDGEVTDIAVALAAGEDDSADSDTAAKDDSGASVGVGAAFSLVYGDTKTAAEIGSRKGTVNAGALTINAASDHKENIASAAGTDPMGGDLETENLKNISLDASVALNILDTAVDVKNLSSKTNVTGYMDAAGDEVRGNLNMSAVENGVTETTSSAFAVGSQTAVGASVALNIANSAVKAILNQSGEISAGGDAFVKAVSHSEDTTKALATAMGADMARTAAKISGTVKNLEKSSNEVLDGTAMDKTENKKDNKTANRINDRLDQKQDGEKGKKSSTGNSTSSNALRSQGVSTENGEEGSTGTDKEMTDVSDQVGSKLGVDKKQDKTSVQVAAAVGVTVASHQASVQVGTVHGNGSITIASENTGNFNTMGTGAAMSLARKSNAIAMGVAVSVNKNTATVNVDGNVIGDTGTDVSISSRLTQNMDGNFAGKLAAQSLAGSVAGEGGSASIAGAVSVLVSQAESTVDIASGTAAKERWIVGKNVAIEATDKSKNAARAGGLSLSTGASVGSGIGSTSIVSKNTVRATVGDYTSVDTKGFTLKAEKQRVTQADYKNLIDMSYLITDSSKLTDEQRQNAKTGLIDLHKGKDDKNYKVEVNLSSEKLLEAVDGLNFLSAQNTYAEAIAGSIGAKGASLAGSFAVAVASNKVNASLGRNVRVNSSWDPVEIQAKDGNTARIIAGSLSAAPASTSVGATVAVMVNSDDVTLEIGDHTDITNERAGVSLQAEATGDQQVFTGAMSVAGGSGKSGEIGGTAVGGAVNVIVNRISARNILGDGVKLTAGEWARNKNADVNVTTKADFDLTAISGSAAVAAGGGVAAGGTVNVIVDATRAETTLGDDVTFNAYGNLTMGADVKDHLISGTASLSAAAPSAAGASGAGAGVVNVIVSHAKANTAAGRDASLTAATGNLKITSNNDASLVNASVAAAGGSQAALGGAFNVNVLGREAMVDLQNGSLTAGGDLALQTQGRDVSVIAGLTLAGSNTNVAATGNVGFTVESNKVRTRIAEGVKAAAGRNAIVESWFSDYAVNAAGSIANSGGGASASGTLVTVIKKNDVRTELGESTVSAGAGEKDERLESLSGERIRGIYVGANAKETQFVGAAGMGIAGKDAINGEVVVLVNNNTVMANASQAILNAVKKDRYGKDTYDGGAITLRASDDTRQMLLAGGLSVSGGAAVGAAVVTLVSNKNVQALAHDMKAWTDVKVAAENADRISQLAVSVGISTGSPVALSSGAMQIGAAIQVLKSRAIAHVGSEVVATRGNVDITADNDTDLTNVAAAVAASIGGGAAVTPVGVVTYFQGEALATVAEGTHITADTRPRDGEGHINVTATGRKKINLDAVGVAASAGNGISGTANILVSKDKTQAIVEEKTTLKADNEVNILANGDYTLRSVSGALAASTGASVGVNAVVSVLKSNTTAQLGGTVTARKNSAQLNVKASAKRDVASIAASLAAGGNVGAGVTVMVLAAGSKMSQDAADMIAYGNGGNKKSKTGFDAKTFMANMEKSGVAAKYLNDKEEQDEDRRLSGDILAKDIEGNGHRESEENLGKDGNFDASSGYKDEDLKNEKFDDNSETGRGENLEAKDTADIAEAKKINTYKYEDAPEDAVIAMITKNASVTMGDVHVDAYQPVSADLIGAAAGVGGTAGVGVSAAVAMLRSNVLASSTGTIDAWSLAVTARSRAGEIYAGADAADRDARVDSLLGGAEKSSGRAIRVIGGTFAAGTVGMGVANATLLTDNLTQATVGGNVHVTMDLDVKAEHDYGHVLAATGAVSAGALAGNASVAVAQANGTVKALVNPETTIRGSALKMNVGTTANVYAKALAASVGAGAGAVNAGVALAINRLQQETGIQYGTIIDAPSTSEVNVKAVSDTVADSLLIGAAVGGVAANLSAGVAQADAKITTFLGGTVEGGSDSLAPVKLNTGYNGALNITNKVTTASTPKVYSLAAGAAAGGGNLLLAFNHTDARARLTGAEITAGKANVVSELSGSATSSLASLTAGLTAAGLSVNYADMQSENRAIADTNGGRVKVTGTLNVNTGDGESSKTRANADTVSAAVGANVFSENVAIARNHSLNYAILEGTHDLETDGLNMHGYGESEATAALKGLDIGLATAAGSAVVALNDADSRTYVKLPKLTLFFGNINATQIGKTDAKAVTGGGSLMGAKITAAMAYGRTNSVIDMEIDGDFVIHDSLKIENKGSDQVSSNITNSAFNAISASAMYGGAYSQDVYNTDVRVKNGRLLAGSESNHIVNVKISTEFDTTTGSTVTPSAGGAAFSLGKVGVNVAMARNTVYAGTNLERSGKGDGSVITGTLDVLTQGKATTDARIESAALSVSGAALGCDIAKSDLSMIQAATLRVGRDLTVARGNEMKPITVQSLTQDGSGATASVGSSGKNEQKNRGLSISIAEGTYSKAIARENAASTAAVLGASIGQENREMPVDRGHYETKRRTYTDYEVIQQIGFRDKLTGVVYKLNGEELAIIEETSSNIPESATQGYVLRRMAEKVKVAASFLGMKPEDYVKKYLVQDTPVYPEVTEEYQEWIPDIVNENIPVDIYDSARNILKAASVDVLADGGEAFANATASAPKSVSLVSGGSLNADAASNGSFSAMFEGVTATFTGDANIKAASRTKATAKGATPGKLTAINASFSETKAGVGERNNRHSVTAIIGKNTSLTANNVNISTSNAGHAESGMEQESGSYALGSITKSSQPTESWYETLISVGESAKIIAGGKLTMTSEDTPTATSTVEAKDSGLLLNFNTMMGKNTIDQENNLDIGRNAELRAGGDILLQARQNTGALASTRLTGGGILSGKTAKAENRINRIARINLDEGAKIHSAVLNGSSAITLRTISGEGDAIYTESYVSSKGLIAVSDAKAYANVDTYSEINLEQNSMVFGGGNVALDARATSYKVSPLTTIFGKKFTVKAPGVYTTATVDSAGGIPLPDAVARNTLNYNTYININEAKSRDEAGRKLETDVISREGRLLVNASNDAMFVEADASSVGKGGFGVANANAWNDISLTNAVWIDKAYLSGSTGVRIYAENGGQLKENAPNNRVHIVSDGFAQLKGIGKAASEARISGVMINQVRSSATNLVQFVSRSGQVVHKTTNPENAIWQEAKAESKITKVMGVPLGKRSRKTIMEWGVWNRCDFCGEGTEYEVARTAQETIAKRYKDAFEKALAPISDIQRMVGNLGAITRARYGEEDYAAAGEIFVLDLSVLLRKDARLNDGQIDKYRLWNNVETGLDVWLLPNATRLYGVAGNGKTLLQYVAELLRGDVRRNGEIHEVDIITALTREAASNPVMPVGSTGMLDFNTGTLRLPSGADFELYLHEVSGKWMIEKWEEGYFQALLTDIGEAGDMALNGAALPEGSVAQNLISGEEADGWQVYWVGDTPETASDADQTLIFLQVNGETDEIDAFRTTRSMMARQEAPVDVSLFMFRDSKADGMEIEKYDIVFFDTPAEQKSLVKMLATVMAPHELEMPRPLRIVLRQFRIAGADLPAYSLTDHFFLMCDGTDGKVSLFGDEYQNRVDGNTFESDYLRIDGILDGDLNVTIKEGQNIWPEWTGETEATDLQADRYVLEDGIWHVEADAPVAGGVAT